MSDMSSSLSIGLNFLLLHIPRALLICCLSGNVQGVFHLLKTGRLVSSLSFIVHSNICDLYL